MSDRKPPIDALARERALDTSKSFLVQAPAGSGKTELLTRRLLNLLAEVDDPEEILAITFTLKATAEMKARVLQALRDAAEPEAGAGTKKTDPDLFVLARKALENDRQRGWNLLQQPERLNILTIDAVCLTIAHETPILSRLGGSLSPTDKPQPLYRLAARRTLAQLGKNPELSTALRALLQLRGTSLKACEELIAGMLGNRDQWGRRLLPLGQGHQNWEDVQAALEAPLRSLHKRALERAFLLFESYPNLARRLLILLEHACGNLDPDHPLMMLEGVKQIRHLATHEHWSCLCDFLLTKGNDWRARADRTIGFPAVIASKAAKSDFIALLDDLKQEPRFLITLLELRQLPPNAYSEDEWQMIQHMVVILRQAVAQLNLVFAEQRMVDFVELGLAAYRVLTDEEDKPTELASEVADRWRHLLVDEFQDTSRSQYQLLTLLTEEWEHAERGTCFLVGDPMQSIYMFRQAEVELFERTRKLGLGQGTHKIALTPLQLQTNFRSHAGLVDPLNTYFSQIFVQNTEDSERAYHVSFERSVAHDQKPGGARGVTVWPGFLPSRSSAAQKRFVKEQEAARVVSIVQKHWPTVEARQSQGGEFQIAILVRARSHLGLITQKLRQACIPFRAVEIEQLGERQEVLDLAALTRALLHPMDRTAWLTVLRAPWCGLTLKDLHMLCGNDEKDLTAEPLLTLLRTRIPLLSSDGQKRAARVLTALEDALRGKHRQLSLASWMERTWVTLGGEACVDAVEYENVRTFFAMLEDLGQDVNELEGRLKDLCAQPDPKASERCGVQLMTIHKAKGLGFDVVIVPGMERGTHGADHSLLRWIEQTRLLGDTEKEEHEFVMAPIGRKGEAGGIYRWIGAQHAQRELDEVKRLFYVAATRAREELHLLGTATVTTKPDGSHKLTAGGKQTLLGIAWDVLEEEFDRCHAESQAAGVPTAQEEIVFSPSTNVLRRLPASWRPPESLPLLMLLQEKTVPGEDPSWERPRGSLALRALGTVVHALVEDLAKLPGITPGSVLPAVWEEVKGWRGRAFAMLRATGLPRVEAEGQATKVVETLIGVLNDPQGRWILGTRVDAATEVSWSTWAESDGGEIVKTLRGDRMFRAGATPGSEGSSHLWIVDYKTGRAGGTAIDTYLEKQKALYKPQLEGYAEVMRKVHGQQTPVCMALYFPLLRRLEWW